MRGHRRAAFEQDVLAMANGLGVDSVRAGRATISAEKKKHPFEPWPFDGDVWAKGSDHCGLYLGGNPGQALSYCCAGKERHE